MIILEIKNKKVLVTGGRGFLGKALCPMLEREGAELLVPTHKELDLTVWNDTIDYMKRERPDIVIHAAVDGGGIGYMKDHPGSVYLNNILMNTHIVEASRQVDVEKFVGIGTVCSYPKFTPVPFKEEDLWNGYPEETNAPYGLAKKMMLVQTKGYHEQYGFNGIHLLMINLYGPHDDFDSNTSHVIPALIKKVVDAKREGKDHIEVWGSGSATREFLYVDDAARGIVLATKRYEKSDPVNLGSGMEISIKDLAETICDLCEFEGEIRWDRSKPDGQPRRMLDTLKAYDEFEFKAEIDFRSGLKSTIKWYNKVLT
ncbi:MAG: GDP-L-fucose synthase [Candidatus Thermoplasmatota archaeon]|nr:GDP-L-fucose synthase [Candidatus Thermoplasmatota archaeon]